MSAPDPNITERISPEEAERRYLSQRAVIYHAGPCKLCGVDIGVRKWSICLDCYETITGCRDEGAR